MVDSVENLALNKQVVLAVIEIIDFYSKKGVFKVNEYKDISSINERLTEIHSAIEGDKEYEPLTQQEIGFIVLLFKEGTTRIPTSVDSFGQIYSVYQHYTSMLEQLIKQGEDNVPAIEELN